MNYISFTILTTDAAELRARMIAYGFGKMEDGQFIPAKPGVEWAQVPNPIIVSGSGTEADPYVRDTRKVFLVKIAHGALRDETKDDAQTKPDGTLKSLLLRTKLGKFIAANSVADMVDGLPARRLGTKFWLIANGDNGRFGVWQ